MDIGFLGFLDLLLAQLPTVLGMILLILFALFIASIARKLTVKGLEKANLGALLKKWHIVTEESQVPALIKTVGQLAYFLVILFFMPVILAGLNLGSALAPITNMFDKFFAFIPNLIAAGLILFVGTFFCKFIKSLVAGLLNRIDVNQLYSKATGQDKVPFDSKKVIEALSLVVYVLIFVPILTLALETLNITTLSQPVVTVLNQVVGIIPNILVALVLLFVGTFVAKLVANLLENLLQTSGLDNYSRFLSFNGQATHKLSAVIAQVTRAVLLTFFLVQALQVLNLEVLNAIGTSFIAYLPSLISSGLILAFAIIGSNILSSFLKDVTNSKLVADAARYAILVLATFMALDQLKFAQNIVQSSFSLILGAFAVAFALAFGLGGKDWAAKQLEKLDKKNDN